MTICPAEIYFYLSCSGLTKTPKSEGLYLLYNFKKFFSYYLLTCLYSSIISSFKVLMEIRWNFSFSNSLIFCFCTLFYNFFRLPSSSLIPSSAMTKLLFYLPTLNDNSFHFKSYLRLYLKSIHSFFNVPCPYILISSFMFNNF